MFCFDYISCKEIGCQINNNNKIVHTSRYVGKSKILFIHAFSPKKKSENKYHCI